MPDRPPHFRKGERPGARKYNAFGDVIRAGNLQVERGGPITISRGSNQTILGWVDQGAQKMDAALTSTIAGDLSYNFKKIVRTGVHTWVDASPAVTGKC